MWFSFSLQVVKAFPQNPHYIEVVWNFEAMGVRSMTRGNACVHLDEV